MGGGARGVKIAIGGIGALVCLRSVAFSRFSWSLILAREKEQLVGYSSAGPPTIEDLTYGDIMNVSLPPQPNTNNLRKERHQHHFHLWNWEYHGITSAHTDRLHHRHPPLPCVGVHSSIFHIIIFEWQVCAHQFPAHPLSPQSLNQSHDLVTSHQFSKSDRFHPLRLEG